MYAVIVTCRLSRITLITDVARDLHHAQELFRRRVEHFVDLSSITTVTSYVEMLPIEAAHARVERSRW